MCTRKGTAGSNPALSAENHSGIRVHMIFSLGEAFPRCSPDGDSGYGSMKLGDGFVQWSKRPALELGMRARLAKVVADLVA